MSEPFYHSSKAITSPLCYRALAFISLDNVKLTHLLQKRQRNCFYPAALNWRNSGSFSIDWWFWWLQGQVLYQHWTPADYRGRYCTSACVPFQDRLQLGLDRFQLWHMIPAISFSPQCVFKRVLKSLAFEDFLHCAIRLSFDRFQLWHMIPAIRNQGMSVMNLNHLDCHTQLLALCGNL